MTEPHDSAVTGATSDGHHTFDELYEHRHALFIALCLSIWRTEAERHRVWRSKHHHDGSMFVGWFVMGIDMAPGEQITYHLPERLWIATHFAMTLDKAPFFDGHKSAEVLKRLHDL